MSTTTQKGEARSTTWNRRATQALSQYNYYYHSNLTLINLDEKIEIAEKDIDGLSTSNNRMAKPQRISKVEAQRLFFV